MRIGLYHEAAGTRHAGGVARFVRAVGSALAEDHTVYLYTGAGAPVEPLADSDVRVMGIPQLPGQDRLAAAVDRRTPLGVQTVEKLATAAGAATTDALDHVERHCDVLFTHQYVDDLLLSRLVDVPTVYEYHGLQRVGAGARARERLSATDWHVANSAFTARAVADAFDREVDGVVRPGVDVDLFAPAEPAAADGGPAPAAREARSDDGIRAGARDDGSRARARAGAGSDDGATETDGGPAPDATAGASVPFADHDEPVVLFVGRFSERKGLLDLLDAAARLETDARLALVGRGDVGRWRRAAADRGVAGDVTIVGEASARELPAYYRACDVCCNPSHYESFCMVNLEAMACGAPLVTTPVGGVTEYATDGENAVLVPESDPDALAGALDRLLADPATRAEIGRAGRAAATEHGWERSAAAAVDVFERALE